MASHYGLGTLASLRVCRSLKTSTVVASRGLNCLKNLFDSAVSWILELSSERKWVSNSLSNYHDMHMAKRITIVNPPLLQTQIEGQKQVSAS